MTTTEKKSKIENYKNSINNYQKSIFFYKKLSNNPNQIKWIANVYRNSAKAYLKLKMNKKAIKEYFKLIKLYQKVKKQNPKYYNEEIAYELFDLGDIYYNIKEYKNAQKVYIKSLVYRENKQEKFNFSKSSTISSLHYNIAQTYRFLGDYNKAIDEYKKALKLYEKLNSIKKDNFKKYISYIKNNLTLCISKLNKKKI